jgi:hypothetical protein
MKTVGSLTYFSRGHLEAKIYEPKESLSNSIAVIISDASDPVLGETAKVFVDAKYKKHLVAAINAFNAAWNAVESLNNVEHE